MDSAITKKRMKRVWKEYQMPTLLRYRIPEKSECAYCACPGEICVYESALANGLRFLITAPIREIMGFLDLEGEY